MLYKILLCGSEFDNPTNISLVESWLSEIPSSIVTFEIGTTMPDNDIDLYFGSQKSVLVQVMRVVLGTPEMALHDSTFAYWFNHNYSAPYFRDYYNEANYSDHNNLFTGSVDYMDIYYRYKLGMVTPKLGTMYFNLKYITEGTGIVAMARSGEEKNIVILSVVKGVFAVIGVYSHPIIMGVEHEYKIVNGNMDTIDTISMYVDGNQAIDHMPLPEMFSDIEGCVGIGGISDVEVSDLTITPITYFYDNFTDFDTISTDTEFVPENNERYFKWMYTGSSIVRTTGEVKNLEISGEVGLFIKSYKFKDMTATFELLPQGPFKIFFMNQIPSPITSVYSGCYLEYDEEEIYLHEVVRGTDTQYSGAPLTIEDICKLTIIVDDDLVTVVVDDEELLSEVIWEPRFGYIGFCTGNNLYATTLMSIEISGYEKWNRGLQIGRYIDDFDYNSHDENNGGR